MQGRRTVLTQRWADIAWAHWPVDPQSVGRLLPPSLTPDLFEGTAWVGLVPFEMQQLRPMIGDRSVPMPRAVESFTEVNVRTYVRGPRGPGVWFCSLDATSVLAVGVARAAWSLPYRRARVEAHVDGGSRRWAIRRHDGTTGRLEVSVGGRRPAGELDSFLTARSALYAQPRWTQRLLWCPVAHEPWRLHDAGLDAVDDGLVRAAGFSPVGKPLVVAAEPVDVRVGLPELIRVGQGSGQVGYDRPSTRV